MDKEGAYDESTLLFEETLLMSCGAEAWHAELPLCDGCQTLCVNKFAFGSVGRWESEVTNCT